MNSFDYSLLEVYFYKKLYSQCNSTADSDGFQANRSELAKRQELVADAGKISQTKLSLVWFFI